MKHLFLLAVVLFFSGFSSAQIIVKKDAEIEQMVKEINADSLQSYIKAMVSFGTRHTVSTQSDNKKGIGAARNWVLLKFKTFAAQSDGRLSAFTDTTTIAADGKRVNKPIVLGNVMATLHGNDTSDHRIFIISAHLDSRRTDIMDAVQDAPGANDDASGVAAVLECARIMSRHNFSATIIFAAVSGEEQGLFGSAYMANKAKKENRNIEAVLNNDIIGSNYSSETNIINNSQLRVFSEGLPAFETEKSAKLIRQMGWENDGKARQLARYVKETGERYVDNINVIMIYRNDRFLRGGDHLPYAENGFAAVRLTEMNENFDHQHQDVRIENGVQYGDLIQFIDFEYLRKNTAVNLSVLASLAKAPSVPQEVVMDVKNLSNSVSLQWQASHSGNAAGYYVLLRETTSPVWQKKIFTTNTFLQLPYSKDNYFFAVQAVNAAGNESLAIVPVTGK